MSKEDQSQLSSKLFEIEQQYHQFAQAGKHAEALDLITREGHLFPDYAQKIMYAWRMTMASRLKDQTLTLQILQDAVDAGYWYDEMHDDPDFEFLHGIPEFEKLVKICEERRAEEIRSAVPVIKILQPAPIPNPSPLLLALHGAQSTVESFSTHWTAAVEHGFLVGLPQSSQAYGPAFSWNDREWAMQEVRKHHDALCEKYPIDPQKFVLAGFSQGGGLASWLTFGNVIKTRSLILIGPWFANVKELIPLLEKQDFKGLRVFIGAGQKDQVCYDIAQELAQMLPQYQIECKLEIYPDIEHNFPEDFEKKLPEALDFVLQR